MFTDLGYLDIVINIMSSPFALFGGLSCPANGLSIDNWRTSKSISELPFSELPCPVIAFTGTVGIFLLFATFVAKKSATPTGHAITADVLCNPEFTFGTLFELGPFHELLKFLVPFLGVPGGFELIAGQAFVPIHPAFETVVLLAYFAFKLVLSLLVEKHVSAIRCGTPRKLISVEVHDGSQTELLIFLEQLFIEYSFRIVFYHLLPAICVRTKQWEFLMLNLVFEGGLDAGLVEYVSALEGQVLLVVEPHVANAAVGCLFGSVALECLLLLNHHAAGQFLGLLLGPALGDHFLVHSFLLILVHDDGVRAQGAVVGAQGLCPLGGLHLLGVAEGDLVEAGADCLGDILEVCVLGHALHVLDEEVQPLCA
jgi:hypothetical protein